MRHVLRTILARLRQARRMIVRVELTLSALQATLWFALAATVVGAALLVRRRLATSAPRTGNQLPVNAIGEGSEA